MSNRDNIEKNTEHLAKRFTHLDHIGLIGLPSIDKVTIILEMTDPVWAVHSIQLLLLHSEHPIRIIALPGSLEFPSIQQYFAKEEPIEFWPYEAGIDRVNQAFVTIETPFVVLMEDRIMVTPRWLSSLIWPCMDEERVMIVSPMSSTEQFDGKLDLWFQSHADLVSYAEEHHPRNQGLWRQVTMLTGSCLLFRRELLDDVGGFDPLLRSRELKVADWCLRARLLTAQLALCEDVYVQALHSLKPRRGEKILSDEWHLFCSKWGIERDSYPLTSISELDISQCLIQPFISIHHEPVFITVLVVVSEGLDTTLEPGYPIQIEQSYSRIQWIGILIGEHEEHPCDEQGIWGRLDALIKVREVEQWHEALEAAFMLVKGEVITFMFDTRTYESDYVTWVVDFMYRESADVVVNTGHDIPNLEAQVHIPKEPLPVPLSLTAHRRIQEVGSYVRSLEEYYFIPRASLRAVYWTKGTEDE
ncbi:glycosyltransferase [Paenibacillus macquariensis]|uniref:Glycosyltransferase like family 2 n=1 Tax=Paenibacillus macquariensis TaxID=948756 RepID=A0ABY1KBK7_9BACL|nr:glycosyltransferase [Paenibacillus macquariensis]MEC0094282.1 glycosyltransferase [Paenibacillus macquariensis]OAB32172.1 hypothetical protein PMSM_18115 [Paenibacillus macquariensis subsp. macquariensis]SIR55631.1 Glycosyltransferase like family 2 [Paenibacillus macquariensis]